jgi:hypothetical protein
VEGRIKENHCAVRTLPADFFFDETAGGLAEGERFLEISF